MWTGYATLAAIVSPIRSRRDWLAIRHICRDVLEDMQDRAGEYRRLDVSILIGERGHLQFARSLGFEPEGVMRGYGSAGEDCILAARVRHWTEAPA